jgi:predicted nucleic acid-binding protein
MTSFVVDASVAAKWFFPEDHSAAAMKLLSPRNTLLAPDIIWSEVANVAWKRVGRGELQIDEAGAIVDGLLRMPLTVVSSQSLVAPALQLAVATSRTVYDCLYLALAIDRKCKLMTADERFANALSAMALGKHIRHVSSIR